MVNRIVLGTAQFGLDYGIDNLEGKVSGNEVNSILKMAESAGIDGLDTAFAYGESELVLGKFLENTDDKGCFNVCTKMAPDQVAATALRDSIARLKCESVYGYLLHDFNATRSGDLSQYKAVRRAVEQGVAGKGGFSLYYPSDLQYALDEKLDFEIVQVPYSLLDHRFEPYFSLLKDRKIEIQVRSVYLQGLVFLNEDRLKGNLIKAREPIDRLRKIALRKNCPVAELCLRFVLSSPYVDRVVIGVNGIKDLRENIDYSLVGSLDAGTVSELNDLAIDDESILLPFLWNK